MDIDVKVVNLYPQEAEEAVCAWRAEEQQVLGQAVQEQRGSQAVARGQETQGEPDCDAGPIPGGGKHRTQGRGGRVEEGEFGPEANDDGIRGKDESNVE